MKKTKELSHFAYGGIEGSKYTPFITDKKGVKETTIITLIIGCILAAVFAASNTFWKPPQGLGKSLLVFQKVQNNS